METFSIPGHQTYIVTIGDRVSISLKPTDKSGPLMTLDPTGRWVNPIRRTIYKIDADGAVWSYGVAKKYNFATYIPPEDKFVPFNHLAHQKARREKG